METTKLETVDYEFEGRVYRLTCNMNAIAYVQDEYDGNLVQAVEEWKTAETAFMKLFQMIRLFLILLKALKIGSK